MNETKTAELLDTLNKHAVAGIVNRAGIYATMAELGVSLPRWLVNGESGEKFRVGPGKFRVPTLDECRELDRNGQFSGGTSGARRGRPAGASTTVKQSKPRPVAPIVPAVTPAVTALDLASRVKTDEANTSIQQAVSTALGIDVLLGQSDAIPYVPTVAKTFVPWGHFTDLCTLVASGHFLPVMVVGPSGNGKTDMCEQVCASLGREYVRVNITNQTDEDDLLGGFRLVNGETKYSLGPIPLAMLRGAVVNLDEIDLGGAALMCLQPVLEGKPLYLKKIGRYISPAPGFTVVATANTKGRGDDGKYAHTTIMNEAMLERFAIMLEQGWPDVATERKIVGHVLKQHGKYDSTLVRHLVDFAGVTRSNFEQQVCNDQIATRRLLHVARVFCALGSIESAIAHTLSRFDADTASAFKNLWNAIHESPLANPSPTGDVVTPTETGPNVPF